MLYQRATSEAAERIADGIDELVNKQRPKAGKAKGKKAKKAREGHGDEDGDDGSAGALVPVG